MALGGAALPADRYLVSIFTGANSGEIASNVNGFLSSASKKSPVEIYLIHDGTVQVAMVLYVPLE